jgi:hypothetical protein
MSNLSFHRPLTARYLSHFILPDQFTLIKLGDQYNYDAPHYAILSFLLLIPLFLPSFSATFVFKYDNRCHIPNSGSSLKSSLHLIRLYKTTKVEIALLNS